MGILHTLHSQRICRACINVLTSIAFEKCSKLRPTEELPSTQVLLSKSRCSITCMCVELVAAHRTLKESGLNFGCNQTPAIVMVISGQLKFKPLKFHNLPSALPCSFRIHIIKKSQQWDHQPWRVCKLQISLLYLPTVLDLLPAHFLYNTITKHVGSS